MFKSSLIFPDFASVNIAGIVCPSSGEITFVSVISFTSINLSATNLLNQVYETSSIKSSYLDLSNFSAVVHLFIISFIDDS